MHASLSIEQAVDFLKAGHIIAYPTEAVFGLGCDPHNDLALQKLQQLKQRTPNKGFILIASSVAQLSPYINRENLPPGRWDMILSQWPGPYTWVFPAKSNVPPILKVDHTVAVRVTAHPIAKALCDRFGGALVSTSANLNAQAPLCDAQAVAKLFGTNIAGVVAGALGNAQKPTTIQDALTGALYRAGDLQHDKN